ncbi:MAG: DUF4169 family protein [Paracoccaceae bacterium]
MADAPINLRRARKARDRAAARAEADANALRHGIAKPTRDLADARRAKAARDLDGHLRPIPEAGPDGPKGDDDG